MNSQLQKNIPEVKLNSSSYPAVTFTSAMGLIVRIALPAILTFFITRMADAFAYRFLGQLGNPSYTAAAGTANVWLLMVMGSVVFGFVSAIDTLVSQNFGKGDYEMCGVHYNRGTLFAFLIALVLTPLAFFSGYFLRLMGMSGVNAIYTQQYASVLVIHMILSPQVVAAQKFLRSQKIAYPQVIITIVLYALHPFWAYLFIHLLNFGFLGAACAKCCTSLLSLVALKLYIGHSAACSRTFVPHSRKSFQGLSSYFHLSCSSAAMNCLSSWGYQIVYFMSVSLPTEQVAANAALININILSSAIPSGISSSMATLVGNSLGARRARDAKVYIKTALIMMAVLCGSYNAILLIFKDQIARHYSSNEELIKVISGQIIIMSIELVFDNLQGVFGGVLAGMGRQKTAVAANLFSYYFVMIPGVYLFVHTLGCGVKGIWIGMTLGYAAVAASYMYIVFTEDWSKLEGEIMKRLDRAKLKSKMC
eukprot:TRINITY_DN1407_c0_g4_i4.p1 TRINITY_DN1407_c0_g4~~TRINITY_DN1407_c0_g4_i4.p1  ORF type:complete len:478 (-),score=58.32 TRINITY_DN1407_c0_g4_i4:130-1563(-)